MTVATSCHTGVWAVVEHAVWDVKIDAYFLKKLRAKGFVDVINSITYGNDDYIPLISFLQARPHCRTKVYV
ncbi:hypothetical protein [Pseudomonas syringae]|uniref:hypothetical protein n=1 Tax=Pseudomonas syringae TaxID=317 RepID=UPI0011B6462F|nr:hypothetical protein [Pseudomonas syringae]